MGSGKTKTGKLIARKLAYEFFDTDKIIEEESGLSVSELFSKEGEENFRVLERKTLRALQEKSDCIVATGGGMPCFFDNMDWMNSKGLTVYLKVPEGMLIQRLSQDRANRPLLKDMNREQLGVKISEQLKQREEYYNQAKIIFDGGDLDIKSLIKKITDSEFK